MNNLDSRKRKLVYFGGIILLSIPIIFLGMPSTGQGESSGGKLAQLRTEHELGEATLGQVDPSSATMNLVLLGLRGVASSVLWEQAIEQQENKDWAGLRATTDSIIMLQPHFLKVWRYQGWNLAFNVSAEWDDVRDRYYWVKEGTKFLQEGSRRNTKMPELYWETANILMNKIGRSDEWKEFRQYFRKDPDEDRFGGEPDREINPEGLDNYLVAKEWFEEANEVEDLPGIDQHILQRMIFRSYPSRAQFGYAQTMNKEGRFNEESLIAWDEAFRLWTEKFGREEFETPAGSVVLEFRDDDIVRLMEKDNVSRKEKEYWTNEYQNRVQYRYWRTLALAESDKITRDAHRAIYDGKALFWQSKLTWVDTDENDDIVNTGPEDESLLDRTNRFVKEGFDEKNWGALEHLQKGLENYEKMLEEYPALENEDLTVEEILLAILYWRNVFELTQDEIPEDFPLRRLWDKHQGMLPQIEDLFRRESRSSLTLSEATE